MRIIPWILALFVSMSGCVVQTEQLEGPPGPEGPEGPEGQPGTVDGSAFMSAVSDTSTTGTVAIAGAIEVDGNAGALSSWILGPVGVGTTAPAESLHVFGADGATRALIEETSSTTATRTLLELRNNGAAQLTLTDTSSSGTWILRNNASGNLTMNKLNAGVVPFTLTSQGDLTISGTLTTGGTTCGGGGCDRVFDPGYDLPTIEAHAAAMWRGRHLPAVGPTPEDKPFNLSKKTGGMLNELEKAHIYIDQLNRRLKDSEAQIARMKTENAQMTKRIERLERLLDRGHRADG